MGVYEMRESREKTVYGKDGSKVEQVYRVWQEEKEILYHFRYLIYVYVPDITM